LPIIGKKKKNTTSEMIYPLCATMSKQKEKEKSDSWTTNHEKRISHSLSGNALFGRHFLHSFAMCV
jgi:hypothetical protein